MYCHKCGREIAKGAVFCSYCGQRLVRESKKSPRSRQRLELVGFLLIAIFIIAGAATLAKFSRDRQARLDEPSLVIGGRSISSTLVATVPAASFAKEQPAAEEQSSSQTSVSDQATTNVPSDVGAKVEITQPARILDSEKTFFEPGSFRASRSAVAAAPSLVGYDLSPVASSTGWITYTLKIAFKNDLNMLVNVPPLSVVDAHVETEEGGTYSADFHRVYWPSRPAVSYRSGREENLALSCNNEAWGILDVEMMVVDMICYHPSGDEAEPLLIEQQSWEISFEIPESVTPKTVVIPEIAAIDLKDLPVYPRALRDIGATTNLPIRNQTDEKVVFTMGNPRIVESDNQGRKLVIDIEVENGDLTNEQGTLYGLFVVDPYGTLFDDVFSQVDCDDSDLQSEFPRFRVDLEPGQRIRGTICIDLTPRELLNAEEYWIWNTVSTLDPRQMGLDPNGSMQVEGIVATFEELREGVAMPDGKRLIWQGNRRLGFISIQERISRPQATRPRISNDYHVTIWVNGWGIDQAFRLSEPQ